MSSTNSDSQTCSFCNKSISAIDGFRCNYCKLLVCDEHRIPENHDCVNRNRANIVNETRNQYNPRTTDYSEDENYQYVNVRKQSRKKIFVGIFVFLIVTGGGFIYYVSTDIDAINQLKNNVGKVTQTIPAITSKNIASIINDTSNASNQPLQNTFKIINNSATKFLSDDVITSIPKTIKESNPVNQKPFINQTKLEIQIHNVVNQHRIQNGLDALSFDNELSNIARSHSIDMSNRNYFDHITPEGLDPTDRGNQMGYDCRKDYQTHYTTGLAENIFQNNLYDSVSYVNGIPAYYDWNDLNYLATSTVDGWMDSTGHRENILTGTYDREGIGVAISSDDKVYVTQNFC